MEKSSSSNTMERNDGVMPISGGREMSPLGEVTFVNINDLKKSPRTSPPIQCEMEQEMENATKENKLTIKNEENGDTIKESEIKVEIDVKEGIEMITDCNFPQQNHQKSEKDDKESMSDGKSKASYRHDEKVLSKKCPHCDKEFSIISQLERHMKIHTGEKPYRCSYCGKAFSYNTNLRKHMMTHTREKSYQCSQCDKAFSNNNALKSHIRVHTGVKPYKCSQCDSTFALNCHLISHMRTHTGEKPYRCSCCEKAFSQQPHLINHMRIHTGEKPYQCSLCTKAFSHNTDIIRHMRTHTGEKPYQCSHCGKSFTHKSDLTCHMRIHTGERPYQCTICGNSYTGRTTCMNHCKKIHGVKNPGAVVKKKIESQQKQKINVDE